MRVADDGELLFRGGQVFAGYWHNDDGDRRGRWTRDGWFHTGDVGEIDDEGFVRITGRKKEILVTAGGKNVAPAVLEDRVRGPRAGRASAWWSATGSRSSRRWSRSTPRPFAGLGRRARQDRRPRRPGRRPRPARRDRRHAVDDANAAVSKAESIRKFTILPDDWTEEGGQLTPSLKLKRNVVMREHRDDVDALYVR